MTWSNACGARFPSSGRSRTPRGSQPRKSPVTFPPRCPGSSAASIRAGSDCRRPRGRRAPTGPAGEAGQHDTAGVSARAGLRPRQASRGDRATDQRCRADERGDAQGDLAGDRVRGPLIGAGRPGVPEGAGSPRAVATIGGERSGRTRRNNPGHRPYRPGVAGPGHRALRRRHHRRPPRRTKGGPSDVPGLLRHVLLRSLRNGEQFDGLSVLGPRMPHSCAVCARCSASTSSPKSEVRSRHTEWAWFAFRWVLSYSIRMRWSCTR